MRRLASTTIIVLLLGTAAHAAPPEPETEEQKTLYALGIAMSHNLAVFGLSEAELEVVQAGLTDGVLKRAQKVDFKIYGPKARELHAARATAAAAVEKKAAQA